MSYLWNEFNIKTFPAQTIVFKDGIFAPELSTLSEFVSDNVITIDTNYDLPIHIIYVGDIAGNKDLFININSGVSQNVFMSGKIISKNPALLQIFIKNAGKNSVFSGKILTQNYSELKTNISAEHMSENTTILIENRVIAHSGSNTELFGTAKIQENAISCDSDIKFSALCAPYIKRILFAPEQRIKSIPSTADHSSDIFKGGIHQIQYLRESGLGSIQIKDVLEESFSNFDFA